MLWQWAKTGTTVFILDLDGTLMPSAEIDNRCYWQAVFACYEKQAELPDLRGFKDVTDSGILNQWCLQELGRLPAWEDIAWIKQRFLELLETASVEHLHSFTPLPGAEDWLDSVQQSSRVSVGIATGGWGHSARFKLDQSGLSRFNLPLASSDDAVSRTDIMQIAARRTLEHEQIDGEKTCYVGDGVWDLKASQQLNWGFVGIASGRKAEALIDAGAKCVQADFNPTISS